MLECRHFGEIFCGLLNLRKEWKVTSERRHDERQRPRLEAVLQRPPTDCDAGGHRRAILVVLGRASAAAEDVRGGRQDPQLLQYPRRKWTRRASAAAYVAEEAAASASVPGGPEKSPPPSPSPSPSTAATSDNGPLVTAARLQLSAVVLLLQGEDLLRPLDGLDGLALAEDALVPELPEALLRDRAQPHPRGHREERDRGDGMSVRKVKCERSRPREGVR